ncbi:MAG: carboxypeptidase regulatory-like domain-containing protein, partial [Acidobacteria bacterium]|nr:carboxypeptidase regulatory-like domain-containing protein [Acidobacteriota bacterium]
MGSRRAKSTYFLVIGLAVVVAGVLATGNAQAQALRVHGTVVDTQGNPLPGAVVKLTPAETAQGPLQGKSNKKGVFTVAFAKPGDYYLSATLGDLKLVQIAVKMRDQDRRPPTLPDGTRIEDAAGPVDPNKPEVPIGIPGNVFEVDLTLTLGTPAAQRAAPAAPAGPAVAPQMAELQKAKDAIMAGDFQTT